MSTRAFNDLAISGEINDIYVSGTEEDNRLVQRGEIDTIIAGNMGDWITISTFLNSWEAYNVSSYPVRYRKDSVGTVHLEGLISLGTISTGSLGYAFQLPVNNIPTGTLVLPSIAAVQTLVEVRVTTDGYVHIYSSSNDSNAQIWTSLSNISFQGE